MRKANTLFTLLILCLISLGITKSQAQSISVNKVNTGAFLMAATIEAGAAQEDLSKDRNVIQNAKRVKIINLGPVVNTAGLDYAPTVSADGRTLYFVSDRKGSKLNSDKNPSHDFWFTKKSDRMGTDFATPANLDPSTEFGDRGLNTRFNEGVASISTDRQSIYFTACMRPDGFGDCDIYKATVVGDKWSTPVNLGQNVNTKYWESQPSISPDQKRIYFASTRPGPNSTGKGLYSDMDIWYSDYDEDNDEWLPAINLSAVNTKGRESGPFIAADNQTLFFSSDSHKPNLGGLDFYFTKSTDKGKTWSTPTNLQAPINTKDDDLFITLPASGDIIYFSSTRRDIEGYQGNLDVFMAFVPSFFKAVNVKIQVVDECTQANIPAVIAIKNKNTNKVRKDSVTVDKTVFETVITNDDYGDESNEFTELEISASNPAYGEAVKVQRITKPSLTYKEENEGAIAEEIEIKISLGQKPVVTPVVAKADYVQRYENVRKDLAQFSGLVMEEVLTWDLYPLLNYVFFDLGSSDIPSRYKLFKNASQTSNFSDTTIPGGTLDKYYHMLNIYGFRLKNNPASKVEIVGCNDGTTPEEKRPGLSKERATQVYNYLKDIWGIEESRMKLSFRDKPAVVSNLKDPMGIVENRRVEIICSDWEIMKPVFQVDTRTLPQPEDMKFTLTNGIDDNIVTKRRLEIKRGDKMWKLMEDIGTVTPEKEWDWMNDDLEYPQDNTPYKVQLIVTSNTGNECRSDIVTIPVMQVKAADRIIGSDKDSTLEVYNLILFPFDKAEAGPINNRIMKDYVYDRVKPTSKVEVIGHTDVVGLEEHNFKLSGRRAQAVKDGIDKKTDKVYGVLNSYGVGEENPLYTNELPEGRFYNRTVQVRVRTPLSEYQK